VGRAVSVRNLHKRYGDAIAAADVSFEVNEGEIFGLLGPNGSGKTTTVECIQGLRRRDGGQVDVFGADPLRDLARVRRTVGSQLQDAALPDRLKVWEALDLFASLTADGIPWTTLLEDWGLTPQRNTAFGDLSGGQKQRLLVALALVNDPAVVILDEMTTGLDPAARRVVWELVEAVRQRGTTVILVTHFMDEAERLCDRLGVMSAGRVVATGTPRQLVADQTSRVTVRFTTPPDVDLPPLRSVQGVDEVARDGEHVTVGGTGPLLARVAHALVEGGLEPEDLRAEMPTLEEAYLALTRTAAAHDSEQAI
jgi:ABC-2 type transport system ATP-binding protein